MNLVIWSAQMHGNRKTKGGNRQKKGGNGKKHWKRQRYPSPREDAAGAGRSNVTMELDLDDSEAGRAGSTCGAWARGLAVPRGHGGTGLAVHRPVGEGCGRREPGRCGDVTYWSKARPQRRAYAAATARRARAGPEGSVLERNLPLS
jgi:hypothetical protein